MNYVGVILVLERWRGQEGKGDAVSDIRNAYDKGVPDAWGSCMEWDRHVALNKGRDFFIARKLHRSDLLRENIKKKKFHQMIKNDIHEKENVDDWFSPIDFEIFENDDFIHEIDNINKDLSGSGID